MSKDISTEIQILINKFNAKKYTDIIKKISILIKKHDNNNFLWNLSGLCFQKIGKNKEAIYSFERAIKINPKNIAAKNNLALSYKNIKNFKKAESLMREILKENPNYLNTIVNLANLKNETYFFEEALNYYKKALEINKNIPEIHLNISNILQANNQIDQAKKHLLKSLEINKNFTIADQNLSMLQDYKDNKNATHIENIKKKLENENLNDDNKIYLHFALGKICEDLKNYDDAFKNYKKGNAIQNKNKKSKLKYYNELSNDLKKIFSQLNFNELEKHNDNGKNIFILGLPRSGTTLLEKIISSHSKVSSVSELSYVYNRINQILIKDNKLNFNQVNTLLKENLSKQYVEFLKDFNIKSEYIIDKTLTNFWYIGFIKILFPNSIIIHSFRNAEDNCLSIFKNFFIEGETWLCDEEEIAKYYLIYLDMMKFWNNMFKDQILNIKYEDLINKSEDKIREIIKFCKLEWEDTCLSHEKNKNAIKTLSVNQANQPIYSTSINSSKNFKDNLKNMFSILKLGKS